MSSSSSKRGKGCGSLLYLLVLIAIIVGSIGKRFEDDYAKNSYTPPPKTTQSISVIVVPPTSTPEATKKPAAQKPVSTPKATKKPASTPKPQATKKPASSANWDVCGTYRLSNKNIDAVIEIRDFEWLTDESFTVTYSYAFTSYVSNDDLYNGPKMEKGVRYTGGPITFTDDVALEKGYVKLNVDGLVDMYICGKSINWESIGPGTGVWIKVKGNYAKTYGEYWLYK